MRTIKSQGPHISTQPIVQWLFFSTSSFKLFPLEMKMISLTQRMKEIISVNVTIVESSTTWTPFKSIYWNVHIAPLYM